ncbi:glycosyltransferase [Hyphomicrobium sp.]|uniref:glycosyltransferase n=1 Tax=Hyphomicrobium sp. TaxID=82 RepID=UPI0025B874E9|nr:glycosyltransferase [Hyphomicrobium sp.]MCC7253997.1 glycosyltransferase [Hyphomicrobium sp.]
MGKAHAALCAASGPEIQRHYVLLEAPRDLRFAEQMRASGASLTIAPDFAAIARLGSEADIVQVEWWNHPRIYECLCRANLPPMRTVFWSHVSGLHAPYIPTGLFAAADCFLLTSVCSLDAPNIAALSEEARGRIDVANSGVGFEGHGRASQDGASPLPIAYMGTVDFSKMSPQVFEVIDAVEETEFTVSIWGAVDPGGEVAHRAAAMRLPERVAFKGLGVDPRAILAEAGIFLYLLQPHHFGTAENALVEAMSLGWAPLVFANPAETAIVRHGETGFVEKDAAAACRRLAWMMRHPEAVARIGQQAAAEISATRTSESMARTLQRAYRNVLAREKRPTDFRAILGETPADWFLSTQCLNARDYEAVRFSTSGSASKGSFSHFLACFPGDPSLLALLDAQYGPARAKA